MNATSRANLTLFSILIVFGLFGRIPAFAQRGDAEIENWLVMAESANTCTEANAARAKFMQISPDSLADWVTRQSVNGRGDQVERLKKDGAKIDRLYNSCKAGGTVNSNPSTNSSPRPDLSPAPENSQIKQRDQEVEAKMRQEREDRANVRAVDNTSTETTKLNEVYSGASAAAKMNGDDLNDRVKQYGEKLVDTSIEAINKAASELPATVEDDNSFAPIGRSFQDYKNAEANNQPINFASQTPQQSADMYSPNADVPVSGWGGITNGQNIGLRTSYGDGNSRTTYDNGGYEIEYPADATHPHSAIITYNSQGQPIATQADEGDARVAAAYNAIRPSDSLQTTTPQSSSRSPASGGAVLTVQAQDARERAAQQNAVTNLQNVRPQDFVPSEASGLARTYNGTSARAEEDPEAALNPVQKLQANAKKLWDGSFAEGASNAVSNVRHNVSETGKMIKSVFTCGMYPYAGICTIQTMDYRVDEVIFENKNAKPPIYSPQYRSIFANPK